MRSDESRGIIQRRIKRPTEGPLREIVSPRQWQVIELLGRGLRNKQIAAILGTTESVIKNYFRDIFDRTGTADRLELACRYAWELVAE